MSLSFLSELAAEASASHAAVEAAVTVAIFIAASLLLSWYDKRTKKTTKSSGTAKHVPEDCRPEVLACPGKLQPGQKRCIESAPLVAAIRAGHTRDLPRLLEGACLRAHQAAAPGRWAREEAEEHCSQLAASALRACATRKCFDQGLAAMEHALTHVGAGNLELWSVLLYSAVAAGRFDLCRDFFKKLVACGQPKPYDYLNLVRCLVCEQDMRGLRQLLQQMRGWGVSLDALSRNKMLAACCTEGATEMAELIVTSGACKEALDVVAYNTLLQGYSKVGNIKRCLALSKEMEARNVPPSAVTFGILFDAAAKRKDVATTREIYQLLLKSGTDYIAMHCTSILRALTSAGFVDEAAVMLTEMRSRFGAGPDAGAYTTVLRAYAKLGRTKESVQLLRQMRLDRVPIDGIAYHAVLEGAVHVQHQGQDVLQLYAQLADLGMCASTAILSVVVKALTRTSSFELAWSFLEGSHQLLGAKVVRPRLFLQLGQACVRGGCGQRAARLYRDFVKRHTDGTEVADGWVAQQLLRTCLTSGDNRHALEIYHSAIAAGVQLHPWVAKSLSSLPLQDSASSCDAVARAGRGGAVTALLGCIA